MSHPPRCLICNAEHLKVLREDTLETAASGAHQSDVLSYEGHWFGKRQPMGRVWGCTGCGFVFAETPTQDHEPDYGEVIDPFYLRTQEGRRDICRQDLDALKRWRSSGRLLDIGCGTGLFVDVAGELGYEAHGIEPSRWAAESARHKGLKVNTGVFGDAIFPDAHFDAVTLWSVLEHVSSPVETLHSVRRILKPGGVIGIVVPKREGFYAKWFPDRFFIRMHVSYFTEKTLTRVLQETRFEVLETSIRRKSLMLRHLAKWFSPESFFYPLMNGIGRTPLGKLRLVDLISGELRVFAARPQER